MITELLPYIFGTVSFLGGIYLGLFSFKIYRPKQKTEEQKSKFDDWLKKFGTIGKICSIILIINGAYDLIKRDSNRYKINKENTERVWTSADREILIKNCMREAQTTAENYPEITREYCECSMDKIIDSLSYDEYVKSLKEPQEKQLELIMPIIQGCVDKLRLDIDSVNLCKRNSKPI
jgi:hypothetical protein